MLLTAEINNYPEKHYLAYYYSSEEEGALLQCHDCY
jgi:hypothetical protein